MSSVNMFFTTTKYSCLVYSYFMLQQAIVQNIFPEVQVPTWHAIANSVSSRYLPQGENILHYCLFKLEITVLLPNLFKLVISVLLPSYILVV